MAILTLTISVIASTIAYADIRPPGRGILTLALLAPHYPVRQTAKVLRASPSPAFGFVYRAFGRSPTNYLNLVQRLSGHNLPLTVVVYGDCGPCRAPRRPAGLFPLILPRKTIAQIDAELARGTKATLKAYQREFANIAKLLKATPDVRIIFQPVLEDDLSDRAYNRLAALGREIFAGRPNTIIGRNSRNLGQARGPIELHSLRIDILAGLRPGDILTGDGETMCFPEERGCTGASLSEIKQLVLAAQERGVHILLWRPETQGLPSNSTILIPPSQRKYSIPGLGHLIDCLN